MKSKRWIKSLTEYLLRVSPVLKAKTTLGPTRVSLDREFSNQSKCLADMSPRIAPKIRVPYVEPSVETETKENIRHSNYMQKL